MHASVKLGKSMKLWTSKLWTSIRSQIVILCYAIFFSNLSFAEPANLSLLLKEVKDYHDSGLYQHELNHKIKEAHRYILKRIASHKYHQRFAIVLDIDETSLSNYNKLEKHNFVANAKLIHQEILAADAPVIHAMLDLYQDAIKHGVKVFFVTGRAESERLATQSNLINAGYSQWSGLYLRPQDYTKESIMPFKASTRAKITHRGYTIIATIGDQYSDVRGGYTEKAFKLPNPFYYLP